MSIRYAITQSKHKALNLERSKPRHQYMLGSDQVKKAALLKKNLGVLGDSKSNTNQQCVLSVKKVNGVCIRRSVAAGWGRWSLLLIQHWGHTWSDVQCWAHQHKRDTELLERVRKRASKMNERLEHPSPKGRLKEQRLFSLEKRMNDQVNHIHGNKYLEMHRGWNQALFSGAQWQDNRQWAPSDTQIFTL